MLKVESTDQHESSQNGNKAVASTISEAAFARWLRHWYASPDKLPSAWSISFLAGIV